MIENSHNSKGLSAYFRGLFVFLVTFMGGYQNSEAAACYTAWTSQQYCAGQKVSYQGYNYTNCFCTNQAPTTSYGTSCSGQGKNWLREGTCSNATAPSVSTVASQGQTSSSGYFNGNVTNNNGATVTSRGFKWGTTSNPTTSVTVGSGNGTFNYNKTGLNPNTTYYYRAWATNSAGTTNGSVLNFTTAANAPTVSSTAATSITSSSGYVAGNVTDNGGGNRNVSWD